jgi:Mat/Ecp fimbriae outer membrane usher protein
VLRLIPRLCLAALTIFSGHALAAEHAGEGRIQTDGVPVGFTELAREREALVDVYFGARKVGEARVMTRPGYLRFKNPQQVLGALPNVAMSAELSAAISRELPSNAAFVCADEDSDNCGVLSPETAGVIYDENRFRVDVFVNRQWLQVVGPAENLYLSAPTAPLSLTSSAGLALSGSSETTPLFNVQNRTIIGLRNARIRTESSYASKVGLLVDTMVGEIDRPGLRYSAGLFWAPGIDLTGQRRILGVGVGTQFDTMTNHEAVSATPIVAFLSQPARVDVLIDGRLIDSRTYEAGNNLVDTSTLPAGSYALVLRIRESNGAVREERRFFAKNAQIAPVGHPVFYGYVGMLANTRPGRPISLSKDFFYQFGAARRITDKVALDLSVIGTSKRPVLSGGAWLISSLGRLRLSGLASAAGDRGVLLQAMSGDTGDLNLNFDLRRIWSHDGKPVIPLSTYVDTFDSVPLNGRQIGGGSYTQVSGSVGYRLGRAYLAVIGSLRKDRGLPVDYSIGPNISWPIVNASGLQVTLQANAERTRHSTGGYVGVRMFFTTRGYSLASTVGRRGMSSSESPTGSSWRAVGDTTANFSYGDAQGTDIAVAGGLAREVNSTRAHAEGTLYSPFGSIRGEVAQDFQGSKRTQYGLTLQTGAVANRDELIFGGRSLEESGVVVSVDGSSAQAEFEILVDGQRRGTIKAGARLPMFLRPYHAYSVRLRAINGAPVWYDSAARELTLYPGNVEHLRWTVEQLITVFGRAIRQDGTPVTEAMVKSKRGISQSNSDGFFQIEMSTNDVLAFDNGQGEECNVAIQGLDRKGDYASVGKVICR